MRRESWRTGRSVPVCRTTIRVRQAASRPIFGGYRNSARANSRIFGSRSINSPRTMHSDDTVLDKTSSSQTTILAPPSSLENGTPCRSNSGCVRSARRWSPKFLLRRHDADSEYRPTDRFHAPRGPSTVGVTGNPPSPNLTGSHRTVPVSDRLCCKRRQWRRELPVNLVRFG